MKCFLGMDGGGTKTECVVLDEAGAIVTRGRGPASNPTRIGFPAAFAALKVNCESCVNSTRIPLEIAALCAGLAGAGRPENRAKLQDFLQQQFPGALVDVRTDLELALDAMPEGPAMVLVVGTGSAAIGRDASGTVKREGGFGPAGSDEGSAFDIGRSAIAAVRAEPSSGTSEELVLQILRHLGHSNWDEVDADAAGHADAIYPRVFPVVAAAADAGNLIAQSILRSAAEKLATISYRLADSLNFLQCPFPLGKTGGTIGRSRFFDSAIDTELRGKLPSAIITLLQVELAEVAAWNALQLFKTRIGAAR